MAAAPGCPDLHRPSTLGDLTSLGVPIAHHQATTGKSLLADLLARSEAPSLVHFVRCLVGMDRQAANTAFSEFLGEPPGGLV